MSIGIPTKNSGKPKKAAIKKIKVAEAEKKRTTPQIIIDFFESEKILSIAIGIIFILLIKKILSMGRPTDNISSVAYYFVVLIILISTKVKIANWSRCITWCVIGLSFCLLVSFFCKMEDNRTGIIKGINPVQKIYNWTIKKINKPPEEKKQKIWETTLTKEVVGKGMDKKIHLLHHPTEVENGNKVIVEGKIFKIFTDDWNIFKNKYEFKDIHCNNRTGWYNSFAPNGEILLIKVQKLVQK